MNLSNVRKLLRELNPVEAQASGVRVYPVRIRRHGDFKALRCRAGWDRRADVSVLRRRERENQN